METNLNPLNINELLAKADAAKDKFITAQKDFYLILAYLDRTKRYKEDKQYSNASFDTFLRVRYNMTYRTYNETRIALFDHPEAVEKHGVGFVRQALKEVGPVKAKEAFKEIDKMQGKRKKPLKTQDKSEVLKKYAMPKPETTKREAPRHDWEFAFKQEHRRAEAMQADLNEKADQVKKLTKALQDARAEIQMLREDIEAKDKVIRSMAVAGYVPNNSIGHGSHARA